VTAKSFDADGCTTMLSTLGLKIGMDLGQRLGMDVIAVSDNRKVYPTPSLSKYFTIADPECTLPEGGHEESPFPPCNDLKRYLAVKE
jgi:hypothetical protein